MHRTSTLLIALLATSIGCDSADVLESAEFETPVDSTPCEQRSSIEACEGSEIEDNCHWQESWVVEIDGSVCGPAEPGPGLCRPNDFNDGGCEPGPDTLYRQREDGRFEIAVAEHRCFGAPGFEQCDEGDEHPACGCEL